MDGGFREKLWGRGWQQKWHSWEVLLFQTNKMFAVHFKKYEIPSFRPSTVSSGMMITFLLKFLLTRSVNLRHELPAQWGCAETIGTQPSRNGGCWVSETEPILSVPEWHVAQMKILLSQELWDASWPRACVHQCVDFGQILCSVGFDT